MYVFLVELPIVLVPLVHPLVATLLCGVWLSAVIWTTFFRRTSEEFFLGLRARSRSLSRAAAWRVAALTLVFAAASVTLQVLYMSILGRPEEASDFERSMFRSWGWLPVLIAAVVIVPIVEEAAIRGYFQGRLESAHRLSVAVIASAVLFALMHMSMIGAPFFVVEGLVLGIVMVRTGSFWASAALHAAGNLMVGLLTLRFGADASPADLPHLIGVPLGTFGVAFLGLAALFAWLLSQWQGEGGTSQLLASRGAIVQPPA